MPHTEESLNRAKEAHRLRFPTRNVREVTPLRLADDRVVIGPQSDRLVADFRPIHLQPREFELAYALGLLADTPVSSEDIVRDIWGWGNLSPEGMKPFIKDVAAYIANLRRKLPEELADRHEGAFRTIYEPAANSAPHVAGFMAVSSLDIPRVNLQAAEGELSTDGG